MRVGFVTSMAAALLLSACGQEHAETPNAAVETKTSVAQGEVVGFRAPNGARVWLGLPFAAPPVGDFRWRAPRPAPRWSGRREALRHGPRCLQLTTGFDAGDGFAPGQVIGAEDCLTLDIYAPSEAGAEPLPVMFWIHGGGNVWGGASQFDGSRLAEQQNVIVVAAQYRLGPLGWFAHPALREDAEAPEDATANFALLDLIAGLRWVRANISAFGGDPAAATVFGESAGGRNVGALLASPAAEGLFHRAVIQSGGFTTVSLAEAEGRAGALPNPGPKIAAGLGVADAQALRALSGGRLLQAYFDGPGFIQLPQVIRDGVVLRTDGSETLFEDGYFHRTPILIGSTRDEAKLFMAFDPRLVERKLWLFPRPKDRARYNAQAALLSRLWRLAGVDAPAQRMRQAGHEAIYAYRFDWDDGGSFLWTDTSELLGAAHALELPFLFNDFTQFGSTADTVFAEETAEQRRELALAMGRAWASFARSGEPKGAGLADWPAYGERARYLRLDAQSDGGLEAREGAETVDRIIADLKAAPGLTTEQRCEIVRDMAGWWFAAPFQSDASATLGCAAVAPAQ